MVKHYSSASGPARCLVCRWRLKFPRKLAIAKTAGRARCHLLVLGDDPDFQLYQEVGRVQAPGRRQPETIGDDIVKGLHP